jgi:predicted dienelactone hydrolase
MKQGVLFFLLFAFAWQAEPMSKAPALHDSIGVKTFFYQDQERQRPVIVEVWYPALTLGEEPLKETAQEDLWIHPREIRDTPILSEGLHPLILMSHGYGGDRRDRSWLVQPLTKAGFVVASVEHYGNSRTTFDPALTLKFWDRPQDVSFALDNLLQEPFLQGKLETTKIGFIGYSLGGMTGLALAGGIPDRIEEAFAKNQKLMGDIPVKVLEKVNFSEAHQSFKDPRIRAILLLAPANFIYTSKALREIEVPVALVASIHDETLPHKEHAYPIIQNTIPRKLKVFRDKVTHSAFLNRMSSLGKKRIKTRATNADRAVVHEQVKMFAAEFFTELWN